MWYQMKMHNIPILFLTGKTNKLINSIPCRSCRWFAPVSIRIWTVDHVFERFWWIKFRHMTWKEYSNQIIMHFWDSCESNITMGTMQRLLNCNAMAASAARKSKILMFAQSTMVTKHIAWCLQ
jgi:hypothetical protein